MSELQWVDKFPNEPGWYWCFQALPKNYGTNVFIVWVDSVMALPRDIVAYYGPVTPPDVPQELVPERYRTE